MHMQTGTMGQNLISLNDEVIGIAFGSDATTEHEMGIQPIMMAFGRRSHALPSLAQRVLGRTGDRIYGIEARRIHTCLELRFEDSGHDAILTFGYQGDLERLRDRYLRFRDYEDEDECKDLATAWCDGSFGIRARGNMRPHLLLVKELLETKRAAILLSSEFLMSGFNIIDATKYPKDLDEKWVSKEKEAETLQQMWVNSGVEKELRAAGKQWFSLGHRVIKDPKDGTLRTWLNPREQQIHKCGWFSFDDLRAWGRNEGPVMMKPKGAGKQ